jgi:filamentous hemagglutinin family protein
MKIKTFPRSFGKFFRRDTLARRGIAALAAFSFTANVLANPTGLTVQSGRASFSASGSQLNITAANNTILNWSSFNIAAGETTTFIQPSAGSIVWNQIGGASASQIYGSLQANGVVILLNSSGFYFGPNSFVSAAGLVVSTANCVPPQNSGGAWEFNGPPPLASIVNYGTIKVGSGGSVFLIADQVENHGSIAAPGGTIGFAAGQTVTLSERPDGRGMSMNVTLPQGSVDNYGNVIADGGTIALNAKVVNQNGLVQANSVQNQNGVIEFVAADALTLGANSQLLAQGDGSASGSAGGSVTLKSGKNFSDTAGSTISTAGGANGGNGGNVEISAPNVQSLNSTMTAPAAAGWTGGTFFLDPVNLVLGTTSGSGVINVNTAFAGFSSIQLQASGNITVADGTTWDLSASTGQTTGSLTMQAGGNIIIGDGSLITDANHWSVSLAAGYNFINNSVNYGTDATGSKGYILFNGSGAIQTGAGGINLVAGQDLTVGSGYVITTGGGSINVQALAGNIDTGSDAQGYNFVNNASTIGAAYNLGSGNNLKLGGISTGAGGNVTLTAGGKVSSYLPVNGAGSAAMTAGSGAYGKQAGNVTIIAGGDVTGNYLVANGTGSIYAGVKMDANGNPIKDASGNYVLVATVPDIKILGQMAPGAPGSAGNSRLSPNLSLDLINGGWNVTAAQDICLQEVVNPNGMFNVSGSASVKHLFDYGLNDYVNLTAGNLVQLGATKPALPRVDKLNVPVIYPGSLTINAGAGGVILKGDSFYNQLILFPSPAGSLVINTIDGGSLDGNWPASTTSPQLFNLVVSDSGSQQYLFTGDFGLNDHAATPVHLGNPTPVELNISGDMNLVLLASPEAAQVNVVGNMNNCSVQAMNLNSSDVTSINVGQSAKLSLENKGLLNSATDGGLTVGGNIYDRGTFTSVNLSSVTGWSAPDFSLLDHAVISDPSPVTLATSFYYNPVTHVLTYQNIPGVSLASVLQQLVNLPVQVYKNGVPQWTDPPDNTIPLTTTVSVINAADAAAMLAAYNSLGAIPAGNLGFNVGGGGQFNVTAQNLDLGTSPGIQASGVGYYQDNNGGYPLASLFTKGADINVNLTGNLDMYSSSIATLNGSSIFIFAAGLINAGSPDFNVNSFGARGIYTTGQGNVTVIANGDINVNGSRIAAYDGGNVTVESLHGNINAGTGGAGYVIVNSFTVDPSTRNVTSDAPTIPGSGILATTFPNDAGQTVGNILVETPNGNVNASAGGIVQLPLNNFNSPNSIVEVLAGYQLQNNGQPVYAGDISSGTPVQVSAGGNIDASGSGVIGNNVKLDATGSIIGVIFARNNLDLTAVQNVNVTALAEGSVNANAGGAISGTLIGVGGISASGGSIDANLESNSSVTGDTSGSKGLGQGTAANATSQAMSSDDTAKTTGTSDDTEDPKKKKGISLAQKVGRVTVLLSKKVSEKATANNPL